MELTTKNIRDSIYEILDKDFLDDNYITDITLDDGGNCIHLTIKGGLSSETIIKIGNAFGDTYPDVYGEGDNLFRLVFQNNKY